MPTMVTKICKLHVLLKLTKGNNIIPNFDLQATCVIRLIEGKLYILVLISKLHVLLTFIEARTIYLLLLISKIHALSMLVEVKTISSSLDLQVTCVVDVC